MRYLLTGEPANQPGGANPNPVFALPPSLPPLIPGAFRLDCDIEAGGAHSGAEVNHTVSLVPGHNVLSCLVLSRASYRGETLCVYIYMCIYVPTKNQSRMGPRSRLSRRPKKLAVHLAKNGRPSEQLSPSS